jgi:hypothetical protein
MQHQDTRIGTTMLHQDMKIGATTTRTRQLFFVGFIHSPTASAPTATATATATAKAKAKATETNSINSTNSTNMKANPVKGNSPTKPVNRATTKRFEPTVAGCN